MRFTFAIALFLLSPIPVWAESVFVSPDGTYSASVDQDEFRVRTLTVKRGEKLLFSTASGYGGYTTVSWSPDSRYLAIVEHGTKTTMTLAVYLVDAEGVRSLDLPDFRLNILGRFQKVVGGRYQFDEELSWEKGSLLQFVTRGSLVDGASNPKDHPDHWYHFKVTIGFDSDQARLLVVDPIDQGDTSEMDR